MELFVPDSAKQRIIHTLESNAQLASQVSYWAWKPSIEVQTNVVDGAVCATWAIWPGTEVTQATLIESTSFRAWAEEAFAIWSQWANLFPLPSEPHRFLERTANERWLLTLVHHDYKQPDLLWRLLAQL